MEDHRGEQLMNMDFESLGLDLKTRMKVCETSSLPPSMSLNGKEIIHLIS